MTDTPPPLTEQQRRLMLGVTSELRAEAIGAALARLDHLEAEVERLRGALEQLQSGPDTLTPAMTEEPHDLEQSYLAVTRDHARLVARIEEQNEALKRADEMADQIEGLQFNGLGRSFLHAAQEAASAYRATRPERE